ncbi:hypothetical protein VE03_07192 [Pseudogymnoascus sp. 23342-1-I1]|nr:hypothetical protein VE03_07192 [Pseudogymnoascus sp. 23342-1-I1]
MIDLPSLAPSRFKLDTDGYRWNNGWPWTWGLMLRKWFQHSGCVDLARIAEYSVLPVEDLAAVHVVSAGNSVTECQEDLSNTIDRYWFLALLLLS